MAQIVVVTGMSGAGRTSALKALEDLGYEAVDNLPLSLLSRLVQAGDGRERRIAIGVDTRTRAFDPKDLLATIARLRRRRAPTFLLYLEADDDTLIRRFTETRRRHPLAGDRPVADGIAREREIMAPLKAAADLVIDTSTLSLPALRTLLAGHFGPRPQGKMLISIVSFGFRAGLPREADLVFDVRFLANPHYVPDLRPGTGRDPEVAAYIRSDPFYSSFEDMLVQFVTALLPRYQQEGRNYLTIAIGCTGGRHRSVFVAERLVERLRASGWQTRLHHRDLPLLPAAAEPMVGLP